MTDGEAVAVVDALQRTRRLQVLRVEAHDERDAWEWLRGRPAREHSSVDATSFALMSRLGLHKALAFGGDFAAAEFVELRS